MCSFGTGPVQSREGLNQEGRLIRKPHRSALQSFFGFENGSLPADLCHLHRRLQAGRQTGEKADKTLSESIVEFAFEIEFSAAL